MPENMMKIIITSSSDVSILLHASLTSEAYQPFLERLKSILSRRTEDASIIGTRVELSADEGFQFLVDGGAKTEPLKIALNTALPEEFNAHLMNCYVKEKSQNTSNIAKLESLSKQLQSKEYELENLKIRCEFQEKEIQLLRQLNTSKLTSTPIKKRRMCGCDDESCRSECGGRNREEDDEMEEETSIDIEEDDDEEDYRSAPLKNWIMQQDSSSLRLVQTPSGRVVFQGNAPSTSKTDANDKEASTSTAGQNDDNPTRSVPELMKKLGVIVRAPDVTSSNIKLEKTEASGPLTLENTQSSSSTSSQKEVVVGVVQYVICQLCPENEQKHTDISNLDEMEAHLLDKHVDKEKKQCEACPSDRFQPGNIAQHMRIHTNSVYACKHCGKRGRKNYLRSHIRTHTGERPYRCDTCTKSFTDSSTLRRHRLVHTGEKKYQCPVCGRAIARKDNVKVHIRSHGIHI